MNYETFFEAAVDLLRKEQRYRVFVDVERIAGHSRSAPALPSLPAMRRRARAAAAVPFAPE
jgi:hypothetical protein